MNTEDEFTEAGNYANHSPTPWDVMYPEPGTFIVTDNQGREVVVLHGDDAVPDDRRALEDAKLIAEAVSDHRELQWLVTFLFDNFLQGAAKNALSKKRSLRNAYAAKRVGLLKP